MIRRGRPGIALLLVLVLVAAGVVLTVAAGFSSRTSLTIARGYAQAERLRAGIAAGLAMASFVLTDDLEANDYDALDDSWAEPLDDINLGDVRVSVTIEDERAKICVGTFSESGIELPEEDEASAPSSPATRRLAPLRTPERETPEQWSWFVELAEREDFGMGEKVDAESLRQAFDEQNASLGNLLHYVTLWTDGRLNVNTAPEKVLAAALEDVGSNLADRLHAKVKRFPLADDHELAVAAGVGAERLEGRLTTSSDTFTICITARIGETERRARYVVRRTGGRVAVLCRVY